MLTHQDVVNQPLLPTIKHENFFTAEELKDITDGHWLFKKLLCEKFIEEDPSNVHMNEFQPNGFWNKNHPDLVRSTDFYWELVHSEYINLTEGTGGGHGFDVNNVKVHHPDGTKEFVDFLHSIKSEFNVEDFYWHTRDVLNKNLSRVTDDYHDIQYYALYDLNYVFEVHCDGRDAKNKKLPRPDSWDDLTPEDWFQEEEWKFTRQGLINLDVADPNDGTVIFDQSFPYCTLMDMSVPLGEMLPTGWAKTRIQFVKGDEPKRYGTEIRNFTHKVMDEDEYDEIMEHCFDENVFPHEATYGLSLERILTLDTPGTMYSWDCQKYHKVKPFPDTVDPLRRRLTLHFHCAENLA